MKSKGISVNGEGGDGGVMKGTDSCAICLDAVPDQGVDHVRDRVGRELLVPECVKDSETQLVCIRDRGCREQIEDRLVKGVDAER